ncbi:MAG: hypothetical protein RSC62_09615 [Cetobacterium sp.]|uniref:hypothetical protein n=1 Tax=Cetobacterium sp. TaxID=2071632 RepID=UPI002FC61B74
MNKKFVIFLDILGFKNKIETGEGMNYIHSLKKLFEETEFFKTKNSFKGSRQENAE